MVLFDWSCPETVLIGGIECFPDLYLKARLANQAAGRGSFTDRGSGGIALAIRIRETSTSGPSTILANVCKGNDRLAQTSMAAFMRAGFIPFQMSLVGGREHINSYRAFHIGKTHPSRKR